MTNHYRYKCPISQGEELLSDCAQKHGDMMKGKHSEIEPRICAGAHATYMCPARSAFRVGGPWHKPADRPHWDEPREKAASLSPEILEHAIYHTLPNDMRFGVAGIRSSSERAEIMEFLKSLQDGGEFAVVKAKKPHVPQPRGRDTSRGKKAAPASNVEAVSQIETNQMAKAVTEAVKASERVEKAPKSKPAPATPKTPKPRTTSAPSGSGKKLTLAQRAKLMREKKAAEKSA